MSCEIAARSPRPVRHTSRMPCQVVRERDFLLIADRIENLSTRGLLVRATRRVLTGERLIVSFQLPHGGAWIDSEVLVARVIHGRRRGEEGRALGLEFETLDRAARCALERHLARVPAVPPGRSRARDDHGARRLLALLARGPSRSWNLNPRGLEQHQIA